MKSENANERPHSRHDRARGVRVTPLHANNVSAPRVLRAKATPSGVSDVKATLMKRKTKPQTVARAMNAGNHVDARGCVDVTGDT